MSFGENIPRLAEPFRLTINPIGIGILFGASPLVPTTLPGIPSLTMIFLAFSFHFTHLAQSWFHCMPPSSSLHICCAFVNPIEGP
jgi:hypothetical protein